MRMSKMKTCKIKVCETNDLQWELRVTLYSRNSRGERDGYISKICVRVKCVLITYVCSIARYIAWVYV